MIKAQVASTSSLHPVLQDGVLNSHLPFNTTDDDQEDRASDDPPTK